MLISAAWPRLSCLLLRKAHEFRIEGVPSFSVVEVQRNAIHRTHFNALRGIKMADAFGAFVRINFVNFDALINCAVRALWLTNVAIDALIRNLE